MPPDLHIYLLTLCIAVAGGLFRGFAGFGSGLLMAPLQTLLHPPVVVVPMLLMLSLIGDTRLLPEVYRDVNARRVLWIAIPALAGLPLGIWVLSTVDPEVVRRVLSVVVLIVALLLVKGLRFANAAQPRVLLPVGALSGVLAGIGGLGGAPVAITFLSLDEPARQTRANLVGYFSISNSSALVMMGIGGVLSFESLKLVALCAPVYFLSVHLGSRQFRGTGDASYRTIALVFLVLVALVGLLWPR